ncbi:pilus assembly protein PilM [Patescibacteria group bacterium]|nr:pilus assembly protein PilM [Patescibacteria group bacterium]
MFSLFQSSSGIYISENEIVLVQVEQGKIPVLSKILRAPLPQGTVEKGEIKNEGQVLAVLKKMREKVDTGICVVGLPVIKCYSAIQDFPSAMNDDQIKQTALSKAASFIPVPLANLEYQFSIVKDSKPNTSTVFIAGIEKPVLDSNKKLFEAAGFDNCQFVLENLALIKAIPVKIHELPNIMFVHNFNHSFLISSVFHGRVFDGILSHNLGHDFSNSFHSYIQQSGSVPTHVVFSGNDDALLSIKVKDLGPNVPKFISAQFKVNVEGNTSSDSDLIVPVGLALSYSVFRKKSSFELLNLL